MGKITYHLQAREACNLCGGRGELQHPVITLFNRDMQTSKRIPDYFEHFGLPRDSSTIVVCPACNGKGYFERTVQLDEALADLLGTNGHGPTVEFVPFQVAKEDGDALD